MPPSGKVNEFVIDLWRLYERVMTVPLTSRLVIFYRPYLYAEL